jgi:trk system potassium uptake protein TrkA
MRVIIMGCGRIGTQLSNVLLDSGHQVVVVDEDPEALARLGPKFRGEIVRGVGFDREVMLKAGIEETEAFAATSRSDNANIVAARIARQIYRVPRVVARIQEPRKVEIYKRLGLITISPAHWGARRISELITHSDLAPVMTLGNGEVAMLAIDLPPHLDGRQVRDLMVPGEISVMAITREDHALIPTSGTEFMIGDLLHVAVLSGAMSRLEALLGLDAGGY